MDPIAIGVSIGTALISPSAKKLIMRATDPEVVAKSINWVFSAVDHFLKVRKKEISKDVPISEPPPSASLAVPSEKITDSEVENKVMAAEEIIKSAGQTAQVPLDKSVKLDALDQFTVEQLAKDVDSLLNQLETYLRNLRFEEEKAAQFGGEKFSPTIVMNTIYTQQEEIAKCLVRLNRCMQKAYNVSAPDLETLAEVIRTH